MGVTGQDGEVATLVKEVVGFEGGFSFDTAKPDGTFQKVLDVSRLRSLGWRAHTRTFSGLTLPGRRSTHTNE